MEETFAYRLQKLFEFASIAEIARRIGAPHATVRNYFQGRMPAPEILIKIANETNVSLTWLLTGRGRMFIGGTPAIDLNRIVEMKIEEIIEKKLAGQMNAAVQDLGDVDELPEFDVVAAVRKFNDPGQVMGEWFRHEGREYPQDYGVIFFRGWESYSEDEKIAAIRDAKNVLDRTLKSEDPNIV